MNFKHRDSEGFVYFNELLFKTMRNIYGISLFESGNEIINKEMKRHEFHTKRQLAVKQSRKNRSPFYGV